MLKANSIFSILFISFQFPKNLPGFSIGVYQIDYLRKKLLHLHYANTISGR